MIDDIRMTAIKTVITIVIPTSGKNTNNITAAKIINRSMATNPITNFAIGFVISFLLITICIVMPSLSKPLHYIKILFCLRSWKNLIKSQTTTASSFTNLFSYSQPIINFAIIPSGALKRFMNFDSSS